MEVNVIADFRVHMQQQQPSRIIWQRLALRAMLAARILGPMCRASAEESGSALNGNGSKAFTLLK